MKPLVSIITPVYNAEKFIEKTIESVIGQTYENWEMILINDCSKDNSSQIIKKYSEKKDNIILIENKVNKGVSFTRNEGLDRARGKYVAFLDADDLWAKDKLEKQISFMEKENKLVCYSEYYKINEDGSLRGKINVPAKLDYDELLKNNLIGLLTSCYNFKELSKFRFKEIKSEDYVFWLEIIKETKEFNGILEPLAFYRILKNSRSSNKIDLVKHQWFIYRNIEKLSIFKSIYIFIIYFIRGLKRYSI